MVEDKVSESLLLGQRTDGTVTTATAGFVYWPTLPLVEQDFHQRNSGACCRVDALPVTQTTA